MQVCSFLEMHPLVLEMKIFKKSQIYQYLHYLYMYIIHISHGFEGDIPEYQPLGDTKALARYLTLWHKSPGALCHSLPSAEGDIKRQGFCVTEGLIFWYSRLRRHVIYFMWHFKIKTKSNKMEYTAPRFFISFYNSAPLFTLLSNSDVGSWTRSN